MAANNFTFLENDFPSLALLGAKAEEYVFSDSNASLIKTGMLCENIINIIFSINHLTASSKEDDNFAGRAKILSYKGYLSKNLKTIVDRIRQMRNKAAHEGFASIAVAKIMLSAVHGFSQWFMMVYGDKDYEPEKYIEPIEQTLSTPVDANSVIQQEKDDKVEEKLIQEDLDKAKNVATPSQSELKKRTIRAENQRPKNEAETRIIIDAQLRAVGWESDTETLRYSKGTRPQKGRNIAIAEWPTNPVTSKNKGNCFADYALFIGEKLYAFVEAKSMDKDIPSVIDDQCKDYSSNVREEDKDYVIDTYGPYQVPFTFATNGRPYLEGYEQKSGIWFLDFRATNNAPKALRGWLSPIGLQELLDNKVKDGMERLKAEPLDVLLDHCGLNLRTYQVDAIKSVEECINAGQDKILVSMATGTGKTRTILGLIYRVLKANRFKRILYLVDRTALGEQTESVFKDVELEDSQTLDKIYNINKIGDIKIEKATKVQVATVQSMVKRILYYVDSENSNQMPGVNDFDLVIIDEAHRGYILDKEMTEEEALYSNQLDYQSKYRSVVDYFNGVKVALTATPALHTVSIFGGPVYNYSYRQAVLDGYLVDFDAPHIIKTKLSINGINYEKGEDISIYDPKTGELNVFKLPDEMNFDVEQFNRTVITRSFNETVLKEISGDISPLNSDINGKTLIYAVNDAHADMIVDILKEIYTAQGIDDNAVVKITGKSFDGNQKKIQQAIKKFKTEINPSVVVTVDLLTTGIDVPKISKLVFLRCVKSRILYEQMLGRATRLCPNIGKDHFEIYDAVGATTALADVSTMKPVVVSPKEKFTDLADKVKNSVDEKEQDYLRGQIEAKLQRKVKHMDEKAKETFSSLSGGLGPNEFIEKFKNCKDSKEVKAFLLEHDTLMQKLDALKGKDSSPVVISDKKDELEEHSRAYGEKYSTPEDYLEAFNKYIKENKDKIEMLNLVYTRPSNLTRQGLKDLINILETEHFTKQQLMSAIKTVNKSDAEISADITTIIRNVALGEPLVSHEEKIESAFKKILSAHVFDQNEKAWLERFKKYLLSDQETVLTVEVLDDDPRFKTRGGFKKIDGYFNNNLGNYFKELNNYIFNENGITQ